MSIVARPYQLEAVHSLFEYFHKKSGNPLVAMPTGTGKSIVIAGFIAQACALYPTTRIGIFTHVKELISQNFEKLRAVWPGCPAGVFSAGLNRKEAHKQILFGGIASIANSVDKLGWFDLIIIDEAHLVSPEDETRYMQVLDYFKKVNPMLKVWGTTATWWRKKHGALTNEGIFTDVCFDLTKPEHFRRFIAEGYLAPLIARATQTKLDVTEVGMNAGDFNLKQLEAAVDHENITQSALREVVLAAEGRRAWLAFCSGIAHAEHVASMLNNWGIPTGVVHSKLGAAERDKTLQAWYAGRLRCVTNNNVLTTGIDYPAVDLIAMLRPTRSSSLWVQMLGRGMRPSPGKLNCLVLDFAGNTARLGPVDDPIIPGIPKPKGEIGDAPVKICSACDTYNAISARYCAYCGAAFPPPSDNIDAHASDMPLMSSDLPVIETFDVDTVAYHNWFSKAENRSVKATYHCGLRVFSEYVCFEAQGFALHKAHNWWMQRSAYAPPKDVDDALNRIHELRAPTRIRVWVNNLYNGKPSPVITAHEWH